MSMTSDLFRLVSEKPVSDEDLSTAALYVLDAVSCAVAGRRTNRGEIICDWADQRGRNVLSDTFRVAGLIHILEIDDLHRESVTHPGCVVVPAAWAVAREHGSTGAEFLAAVLRGYEFMARVGASVGPAHYKIWHNTATCGPFGSAAAASSLLGLSREETVWALGNAGTQASGLWEFIEEGAMSKHLHSAHAAEAGVTSAELARRGFTGPRRILEGDRGFFRAMCPDATPDRLLSEPSGAWELTKTSIKPWPSCRHTHPAVDAALELHAAARGATISGVEVDTYSAALTLCDRPAPETEYEAKFSLQYCVAAALSQGEVGLGTFDAASRAAFRRSSPPVTVGLSEGFEQTYPDGWGARVTVELEGGQRIVSERAACLGDPEAPIAKGALRAKAKGLLEFGGQTEEEANRFVETVARISTADVLPDLRL